MLEQLESRRLLSGVFYDADSMSIKVHGTREADDIHISRRGERILVEFNDQRRWFDRALVKWVEISGSAGDDLISGERTGFSIQAWGGAGRDTLIGGFGDDRLNGGDGADKLIGNAGDDNLDGEGGRDLLSGGSGRDTIDGGGANDMQWGNDGDDFLQCRAGNDVLDGGDGADNVVHYLDQGELVSVEAQTILNTPKHDDPYTFVSAIQRKDGKIVVRATGSHMMGGYEIEFGEMSRNGRTFRGFVKGTDLAGPDGGRIAVVVTKAKTYILGQLADGIYTFNAGNDQRLLATIQITVSGGQLVNTPAWSGPYQSMSVYTPGG